MKEVSESKEIVGIDLGNCFIRVYFSNKTIVLYNSLLLEKGNAYINKKPTSNCLIDILMLVGIKFEDKVFGAIQKYYNYSFKKGFNKNILVIPSHETVIV
jgi:hypothetical protein